VRFSRIKVRNPENWRLVSLDWMEPYQRLCAAEWFNDHQGDLYDWRGILGFLAWPLGQASARWTCSEACGAAMSLSGADRFEPASLDCVAEWRTT
jgi:hypothetical protein